MDISALEDYVSGLGQKPYRARQLADWIYGKFTIDFREMKNLHLSLREQLEKEAVVCSMEIVDKLVSVDDSVKYLLGLTDGKQVEMVWIPQAGRNTLCISTQVGCPVMCRFCLSGRDGLERNLSAIEIAGQVLLASNMHGAKPDNIVVMGMGEPLLNFDNLAAALCMINDSKRFSTGARRITVSTSGIVPGIRKLAELGKQYNLAVSIHSPDDETRAALIPDHYRYGLDDIVKACVYYLHRTNRKVSFEYVLVGGLNARSRDIRRLAGLACRAGAKINLIPCNPAGDFCAPSGTEVDKFAEGLDNHGCDVTVRFSRGADILAACGQLKAGRKE